MIHTTKRQNTRRLGSIMVTDRLERCRAARPEEEKEERSGAANMRQATDFFCRRCRRRSEVERGEVKRCRIVCSAVDLIRSGRPHDTEKGPTGQRSDIGVSEGGGYGF